MKKNYVFFVMLLSSFISISQTDAISYQAVILNPRSQEIPGTDIQSNIFPNKLIAMRFTVLRSDGTIDYQETQLPMTDAYGMVNLFIGEGTQLSDHSFNEIEWDGQPKNLKVEIDFDAGSNFTELGTQKITFVPYSFHRNIMASGNILISGESTFEGNMEVGENTNLFGDLTVAGNVQLDNGFSVSGITTFEDDVIINGDASLNNGLHVVGGVLLETTLTVEGDVNLNNNINISGLTNLNDNLVVNGDSQLNGTLDVSDVSTLNGSLSVEGETSLHDDLTVAGNSSLSKLEVRGEGGLTGNHIAVFENTDGSGASGILIQLGKTHGAWDGTHYLHIDNTVADILTDPVETVQDWFNGDDISPDDILSLIPSQALAGSVARISNAVIDNINEGLDLPRQIVPRVTVFPEYNQVVPNIHISSWTVDLPGLDPFVAFPGYDKILPDIHISRKRIGPYVLPEIPQIDTNGIPYLSFPSFNFSNVSNSLDKNNEYITFTDKEGRKTGAVKAQSVNDWKDKTILNGLYLLNVATAFIKVDQLGAWSKGVYYLSALTEEFNSIGVEYSSGNGDYAEWLEREKYDEFLTPGDIVGVRAGKISKELDGAEQVMVVSNKPIVLGNLPNDDMVANGNTVAFMGQIPVKVMGSVQSGDYIVPNKKIPGYGQAINPKRMTINDYKVAVGRAWETDLSKGPKMVNTVVGIHNRNWINIFKEIDYKQEEMSQRLQTLENEITELKQMISINSSLSK